MSDGLPVFVEWVDGAGNTWEPGGPPAYLWPPGLQLPRVGDSLKWPGVSPRERSGEVVSCQWLLYTSGGVSTPAVKLTCDLGAYSGDVVGGLS